MPFRLFIFREITGGDKCCQVLIPYCQEDQRHERSARHLFAAQATVPFAGACNGGIFGFIYEEIFYRIDFGYFVKRGTAFGPWILFTFAAAEGFRCCGGMRHFGVINRLRVISFAGEAALGLQHGDMELGKYRRIRMSEAGSFLWPFGADTAMRGVSVASTVYEKRS